MPQNGLFQHGKNEPSKPDGQAVASPRPINNPEPETATKAGFLGIVKGTAMGIGSKAGKWLWEKGEDLKGLFTGDGH
ncbi:hypothetical protein OHT59_13755 [Streptomyces sp. NBC_00243]|uniref:hypothetical protein n=1 Tax=Streptomyces sp. NBC_00243 TaxID=2975688 RepID=UPI002DDB2DC5|nr:hypothetical protein [Streptomyces sp. NBC_00243]WRZ19480.1 hypothetical protein OHT59_13755 [Streptomyces sp. NBC_00243]